MKKAELLKKVVWLFLILYIYGSSEDLLMTVKLNYEELENRVKELEEKLVESERKEKRHKVTVERLRDILGGFVKTIAMTVEARDPYTAGHQRRVANLARYIGSDMGLSEEQTEGIRVASIVHDLGKISIPAEILSKPSLLSEHEIGLVRTHSQVGFDILKNVEFPWPIAEIVYQHHERMDGSGYPLGVSGEEILMEARVLAVADTFEAMATHRPYRPAFGTNDAIKEIFLKREKLYEPKAVDACMRLVMDQGFEF
jgi:HD-GYP domain-containing protein (c-di-GMP phosphodiesterase class II)